jgi:hypothetical protein
MGREEQVEEREVLDSIFPEEIQGMLLIMRVTILGIRAATPSFNQLPKEF